MSDALPAAGKGDYQRTDFRSLDPCWACGEVPSTTLVGRLPTCADHLHTNQEDRSHRSMTGPVAWFGGKGHISGWVAGNLPPHTTYVEPYGGAASVLFAKMPAPIEVYNDLHGDLTNLFRVIRDPDLIDELDRVVTCTLHSRSEYEAAVDLLASDDTDPLRRAVAFFIGMNQGFGGTYPTLGRWGRARNANFVRSGMAMNTAQWWRKVSFLADWHERLARVQVENRDALTVIADYDSPTTTFYLDPPYPEAERVASLNAYKHEVTDDHHRSLVDIILNVEGHVVLSGYDTPLYAPLDDAGWQVIERAVHARGAGNAGGKKRSEWLWVKP